MSADQKNTASSLNLRRFPKASPRVASHVSATRRAATAQPMANSPAPKAIIRYAYYVFIFSLPFEAFLGGMFFLGLILVGSVVFQLDLFLKRPPKSFWCFVIYLSVVAVWGLLGILEAPQDNEFRRTIVTQLFRFSQLLVFFLIAYRLMMFESIAKSALLIFAVSCVLLAVLQASGLVSTGTDEAQRTSERMTALGNNPNVLASILGLGLLSLVGLAYGRKDMNSKLRVLAWLTSGFLLISIVRTGARGNLLALIVALIALTVRPSAIAEKMKTIAIAFIVIISLAVISYQIDAVRERWEKTYYEGDVASREKLVPAALGMILDRPITGWGPVNFNYVMDLRSGRSPDPHNTYLWLMLETGLLGAGPFFIGLWLCWCSVWRARRSVRGSLPLALLLFMLAVNMKGTYLYFKFFWVTLAYALASGSYALASSRNYLQASSAMARGRIGRPHMRKSFS